MTTKKIEKTGFCLCGCRTATASHFAPGHDLACLKGLVVDRYGSIAAFVIAMGGVKGRRGGRKARGAK